MVETERSIALYDNLSAEYFVYFVTLFRFAVTFINRFTMNFL